MANEADLVKRIEALEAAYQPDKYDRAYYHREIEGHGRLVRLVAADNKAQFEASQALTKRVEALEAEREELRATIGELKNRLAEHESKHAAMATWVKERLGKQAANGNATHTDAPATARGATPQRQNAQSPVPSAVGT